MRFLWRNPISTTSLFILLRTERMGTGSENGGKDESDIIYENWLYADEAAASDYAADCHCGGAGRKGNGRNGCDGQLLLYAFCGNAFFHSALWRLPQKKYGIFTDASGNGDGESDGAVFIWPVLHCYDSDHLSGRHGGVRSAWPWDYTVKRRALFVQCGIVHCHRSSGIFDFLSFRGGEK